MATPHPISPEPRNPMPIRVITLAEALTAFEAADEDHETAKRHLREVRAARQRALHLLQVVAHSHAQAEARP